MQKVEIYLQTVNKFLLMDEPELYARCENSKGSLIETVVLFGEVIGIGSRIEKCVKNMHQMRRISCFQVNAIAG